METMARQWENISQVSQKRDRAKTRGELFAKLKRPFLSGNSFVSKKKLPVILLIGFPKKFDKYFQTQDKSNTEIKDFNLKLKIIIINYQI